jgi:hypothetical protein
VVESLATSSSVEPYLNPYYFSKIFMCQLRPTQGSACQTKLFEAMADVQTTSVAAIHAASPRAAGIGTSVGSAAAVAHEVMIEQANVAMLKLTGILKSKDKA